MSTIDRRTLVQSIGAVCTLGAATLTITARATAQPAESPGPFQLPPLPYPAAALEPFIDATTMGLHHDKHHAAYVKNLNDALAESPQVAKRTLEELLANLGDVPESVRTRVRNNGGGHANHTMFWQVIGEPGGPSPDGELQTAIERDFGGLANLKDQFNTLGSKVFGSGWVFVTVDTDGKLALESKPNQDTPLMDGKRVLFGNDVWEHAYYLKYQNKRADYLAAWWNVANWKVISERYTRAKLGQLGI